MKNWYDFVKMILLMEGNILQESAKGVLCKTICSVSGVGSGDGTVMFNSLISSWDLPYISVKGYGLIFVLGDGHRGNRQNPEFLPLRRSLLFSRPQCPFPQRGRQAAAVRPWLESWSGRSDPPGSSASLPRSPVSQV